MTTPASLALLEALAGEPHRPRITVYGTGGARSELSTASLANWAAKTAGLLVDELGAEVGDQVFVAVDPGWQLAAIVLGAWWAGLAVTDVDSHHALTAFVNESGPSASAAAVIGRADSVFVVSGHPLGAPAVRIAAHQRDFGTAVLPQADRFTRRAPVPDTSPAVVTAAGTLTVAEVLAIGRSVSPVRQARVLTVGPWVLPDPLVTLLVGALTADGSLVVADPALPADELARLAVAEKVTVALGVELPGLSLLA